MTERTRFKVHPDANIVNDQMREYLERQHVPRSIDLDARMEVAKRVFEVTYKHASSDGEAFRLLETYADLMAERDPQRSVFWRASVVMPNEQISTLWMGRWAEQAYPRVVMDEKYAALLMATEVPQDALDLVVPPWHAFFIEVPAGLVWIFGEDGERGDVRHLLVHVIEGPDGRGWNFIGETDTGLQVWRHGLKTHQLTTVAEETLTPWENANFMFPVEDHDERVMQILGRLIASVCVAMSDPANFHEQKRSKGRGQRFSMTKGKPVARTFVVGRPVVIDCRPAIREFVEGKRGKKGSSPRVRYLVRGHWRRVACGPNGQERRLRHIEPYWKGPEEAAIVPRTVVLEGLR